jgi:hypothetical protein
MSIELPSCVQARRVGHWSFGSESEYDALGEQAPLTWTCNCSSWLTLEIYDFETESYVKVSEDIKAKWLSLHQTCVAKCYKCGIEVVERQGLWCEDCSDAADSILR